jgi:MerR family transcriptional regulator, light-induced transcriptional regulator
MNIDAKGQTDAVAGVGDAEIARLAARAIAVLLRERDTQRATLEARLMLLCDAFLSERVETRHAVLGRMRLDGIPVDDLIDVVLPEVARFMGRRWAEDDISFADVTIGAARLQETVRLMANGSGRNPERRNTASSARAKVRRPAKRVLLVVPRPEHHTLGVFVVADQLRRRGYETDIAVDMLPRQVAEMVLNRRYCMVGITASGRRALASARELVETIRASVRRVTPIVLGGSIVAGGSNLKAQTGVDHVVRDVETALRLCGLEGSITELARTAPDGSRTGDNRTAGNVSA